MMLGRRQTGLGDASIQNLETLPANGRVLVGDEQMPATTGLYMDPSKIVFGVLRDITVKIVDDPREDAVFLVIGCALGVALHQQQGHSKLINIAAASRELP